MSEHLPFILAHLKETYPDAKTALFHRNAFELLVATILAAQAPDERVNKVTSILFERYPNAAALNELTVEQLEEMLKSLPMFRNKSKALKGMALMLVESYGGEVPASIEELVRLPGVARKTANVVLGNVFNINAGIPVDTHVSRLALRLGLTREIKPEKIEKDMMERIPTEDWAIFSLRLVDHGRAVCDAKKPKCAVCGLNEVCAAPTAAAIV